MLSKQLIINMICNLIAFATNLGINFILTPYLINNIGKEAYSFFPIANSFINYTSIITVALNAMAARFITIKLHENKDEEVNIYFNSVLVGNAIISFLMVIPLIIIVLNIENIFDIPMDSIEEIRMLFSLIFFSLIINILSSVFGIATFAKNRLDINAQRNIYADILRVTILVVMFISLAPSVVYLGVSQLIVTIFLFIYNLYYTKKLLPEIRYRKKYFRIYAIKELVASGIWNSLNQLSIVLLSGLDLIIANTFINAQAAGTYAIVKTIPNFIQSFLAILTNVFVPELTILYAKKELNQLIELINISIKIIAVVVAMPLGFLFVFSETFYSLWVPGENSSELMLLSLLTLLPMLLSCINPIFNIYTIANKVKIPSIVLIISAIINTACVFFLLIKTDLGIIAIPLVSAIIGILRNGLFTPLYAARCLKVRASTFYIAIVKGMSCTLIMILVASIFKNIFVVNKWSSFIGIGASSSLVAIVINFFIIFNGKERDYIYKSYINKIFKRRV